VISTGLAILTWLPPTGLVMVGLPLVFFLHSGVSYPIYLIIYFLDSLYFVGFSLHSSKLAGSPFSIE
jgi:hypothetical protein